MGSKEKHDIRYRDELIAILGQYVWQLVEQDKERRARVHMLEEKIVRLKQEITKLQECRTFERETERYLEEVLQGITMFCSDPFVYYRAVDALDNLVRRRGPRE
jgi:hypothetical protein